jgi:hypothetical protein
MEGMFSTRKINGQEMNCRNHRVFYVCNWQILSVHGDTTEPSST